MRECRGKRVDNGEWVYGWYIKFKGEHFITNFGNRNGFIGGFEKVIPETVGQFTGRKDKKGIKIYFGNKLRFTDKAEWYKNNRIKFNLRQDRESFDEILTNHEKYPYEERVVESIEDYEWLLSSEIQEHWEIIV